MIKASKSNLPKTTTRELFMRKYLRRILRLSYYTYYISPNGGDTYTKFKKKSLYRLSDSVAWLNDVKCINVDHTSKTVSIYWKDNYYA
jgi:hypothetical protein